jgi:hypothetical protein
LEARKIRNLEDGVIVRHADGSMLPEGLGEQVACASAKTERVGHACGREEEKRKLAFTQPFQLFRKIMVGGGKNIA